MIGILDSGLGGLSFVKALKSSLAGYDMVYFGDTARAPYGDRSPEKIIQFSEESLNFLLNQGATVVVIACSTISSIAAAYFQRTYRLPVLEAVTPVVSLSAEASKRGKIGVIGTSGTVASRAHESGIKTINPHAEVYSVACPLLVPIIEAGVMKRPETIMTIKKYLYPLKMSNVDTLIMGCNHYSVIKNTIQRKMGKKVRLIDPVTALAASVQQYLVSHDEINRSLGKNSLCRYYVSDVTDDIKRRAMRVFTCDADLENVSLKVAV
jgi:glutamate racemase